MSLQGQERVVTVHPATVINHPDERHPAASDDHLDLARAGVDAVFHQLLHDGGRPFHHFACGHLTGDDFGQEANATHGELVNVDLRFSNATENAASFDHNLAWRYPRTPMIDVTDN